MNRKLQILVGTVALLVIAVCLGLRARIRIEQAEKFSQLHQVQTYGGTNYVVQLVSTTVGAAETGYVVVVELRLENPDETNLVLDREWFVLADQDRNYYLPSTTGTQTRLIKIPARSVDEKELLTYTVEKVALNGSLVLRVGTDHWAVIKTDKPFRVSLGRGSFRTFHRADW